MGNGDPVHMMGEQGALERGGDTDMMVDVTDVEGETVDRLIMVSRRVNLKT